MICCFLVSEPETQPAWYEKLSGFDCEKLSSSTSFSEGRLFLGEVLLFSRVTSSSLFWSLLGWVHLVRRISYCIRSVRAVRPPACQHPALRSWWKAWWLHWGGTTGASCSQLGKSNDWNLGKKPWGPLGGLVEMTRGYSVASRSESMRWKLVAYYESIEPRLYTARNPITCCCHLLTQ